MYKVHAIKSSHLYYFVLVHIHHDTQPRMAVCLQARHVCPHLMLSHMINAKKDTLGVMSFKKHLSVFLCLSVSLGMSVLWCLLDVRG